MTYLDPDKEIFGPKLEAHGPFDSGSYETFRLGFAVIISGLQYWGVLFGLFWSMTCALAHSSVCYPPNFHMSNMTRRWRMLVNELQYLILKGFRCSRFLLQSPQASTRLPPSPRLLRMTPSMPSLSDKPRRINPRKSRPVSLDNRQRRCRTARWHPPRDNCPVSYFSRCWHGKKPPCSIQWCSTDQPTKGTAMDVLTSLDCGG